MPNSRRKKFGFSKVFKNVNELTDVMSVVLYCIDDKTYLLAHDCDLNYHIPYVPVTTHSWNSQVKNFVKEYLGISLETGGHLWRIIRFWKSDEEPYVLNTVFEVSVSKDMKHKAKIYKLNKVSKTSWITQEEFDEFYNSGDHGMCPDVAIHFTVGCEPTANLGILQNCALVQNYNLIEVTRKQFINNNRTHVFDNLLSCLMLSASDITVLHDEYLKVTYPHIIMGAHGLSRFASVVGWNDYLRDTAYRGVDYDGKNGLTFRELLYLIHAVDSNSKFKGNVLDARNRFLFRCFDSNRDDKLSQVEFTSLIQSAQASRNSKQGRNISVEDEVELTMKAMDLRPGNDIPVSAFLRVAATSKFSHFLNVLKATTSILDFINSIRERKVSLDISKMKSCPEMSISKPSKKDFMLSSYMSRIDQGSVAEVIDIDKVDGIILRDIKVPLVRSPSADLHSIKSSPQNEILAYLKYFANPDNKEIEAEVLEMKKTDNNPKEKFSWGHIKFETFVELLIRISATVANLFNQEKRMLILNSPIYIIGDVHGNIQDLCCFEQNLWPLGISLLPCNLLFLGDYVDRGESSIEIVAYLFAQKIRFPQSVFLIRGNHEIRSTQRQNVNYSTFFKECKKRCGAELGYKLWNAVNDAFDCMPLAACVDKRVFCCHGGIPPPWVCPTIQAIQNIPIPLPNPENNGIAWELMWNDPARQSEISDKVKLDMAANEGFSDNVKRSTGHIFNEKALDKFLQVNQLSFLVRAHESQKAGFQIHHNWKMLTVFSSSFYTGFNKAACALVQSNGKIKVVQLTTDDYHPDKLKQPKT